MVQLLRTWERHRNMTCQCPYSTCWPSKNVLAQDLRNGHLGTRWVRQGFLEMANRPKKARSYQLAARYEALIVRSLS